MPADKKLELLKTDKDFFGLHSGQSGIRAGKDRKNVFVNWLKPKIYQSSEVFLVYFKA